MAKKKPYQGRSVDVHWDVFLESPRAVDALIEFIEGRYNSRELWTACRSKACRREADRMRVLGNYKSREQAKRFLQRHYSW